jgi:hypothetical protein
MPKTKKAVANEDIDQELEDALEATFPASDPVHIGASDGPDRPVDRRPAQIDKALVDKLAREVGKKKGAA